MGPRAAVGAALAAVSIASACSLADFSAFTDGNVSAEAGSPDATAGADDGGPSATDGSIPPASDGGTDATADASFCARNADAGFFCEDFEGPNALGHFASTSQKNGSLSVDDGTMVANAPAGAEISEVFGVIAAGTSGSKARLELVVRPEQLNLTTDHSTQLAKFMFYGSVSFEVGIGVRGKDTSEVFTWEYTPGYYKEFGSLPPLGSNVFTRFLLDVRIDDGAVGGRRLLVDRDGVRVVSATLTPPIESGTIEAFIGVPFIQAGHGPWRFRFDDIVMGLP